MITVSRLFRRPASIAALTVAGILAAGQALAAECGVRTAEVSGPSPTAECTIETIDACTLNDPVEAERVLLAAIGNGQDPALLYRLAQYYHNAPPLFRDPVLALWYVGRAAALGYEPAIDGLTEMPAPTAIAVVEAIPAEAPVAQNDPTRADPRSTLGGIQISLDQVMTVAYAAGFCTETQLLAALSIAIAESSLWTAARNWKPESGFRPASDYIGVQGPPEVWYEGRQMHSDRGLWQISSATWSQHTDHETDDPMLAAEAAYEMSGNGTNFSLWDSFTRGSAQRHYDREHDGWPALRPLVQQFLAAQTGAVAATP